MRHRSRRVRRRPRPGLSTCGRGLHVGRIHPLLLGSVRGDERTLRVRGHLPRPRRGLCVERGLLRGDLRAQRDGRAAMRCGVSGGRCHLRCRRRVLQPTLHGRALRGTTSDVSRGWRVLSVRDRLLFGDLRRRRNRRAPLLGHVCRRRRGLYGSERLLREPRVRRLATRVSSAAGADLHSRRRSLHKWQRVLLEPLPRDGCLRNVLLETAELEISRTQAQSERGREVVRRTLVGSDAQSATADGGQRCASRRRDLSDARALRRRARSPRRNR